MIEPTLPAPPTEEIQRVPAHTKPHYWIAVRGADIWNRWAREGVGDEWFAYERKKIEEIVVLDEDRKKVLLQKINEFEELEVLEVLEREEITNDIIKHCNDSIILPNPKDKIDFSNTIWKLEKWVEYRKNEAGHISLSHFIFTTDTCFKNSIFENKVSFESAFSLSLNFDNSSFLEESYFLWHSFETVNFYKANFRKTAIFCGITCLADARFHKIKFQEMTFFNESSFYGSANFSHSVFSGLANFQNARFFHPFEYIPNIDFTFTEFSHEADFTDATFYQVPSIAGAKCEGVWRFSKNSKGWPHPLLLSCLGKRVGGPNWERIATDYSQLRKRMEELKLHDNELFFHGKELEARSYHLAQSEEKKDKLLAKIYKLYGSTSNHGQSIFAPFKLGGLSMVIAFLMYWCIIIGYSNFPALSLPSIKPAIYLALHHFFSFLPTDAALHAQLFNVKELCDGAVTAEAIKEPLKETGCGFMFSITAAFQKIISLLCWGLVALGLRNNLRMR